MDNLFCDGGSFDPLNGEELYYLGEWLTSHQDDVKYSKDHLENLLSKIPKEVSGKFDLVVVYLVAAINALEKANLELDDINFEMNGGLNGKNTK